MSSVRIGTCSTCSFYRTEVYPHQCRANPPQAVVYEGKIQYVLPEVDDDDFCQWYRSAIIKGRRKNFARQVDDGDIPTPVANE